MHHVEKDYGYRKAGYAKQIWDYSIDYQGPSPEMQQLAAFSGLRRLGTGGPRVCQSPP